MRRDPRPLRALATGCGTQCTATGSTSPTSSMQAPRHSPAFVAELLEVAPFASAASTCTGARQPSADRSVHVERAGDEARPPKATSESAGCRASPSPSSTTRCPSRPPSLSPRRTRTRTATPPARPATCGPGPRSASRPSDGCRPNVFHVTQVPLDLRLLHVARGAVQAAAAPAERDAASEREHSPALAIERPDQGMCVHTEQEVAVGASTSVAASEPGGARASCGKRVRSPRSAAPSRQRQQVRDVLLDRGRDRAEQEVYRTTARSRRPAWECL